MKAPRSSRLLNLRQMAYQTKGLKCRLDESSVAVSWNYARFFLDTLTDIIGFRVLEFGHYPAILVNGQGESVPVPAGVGFHDRVELFD